MFCYVYHMRSESLSSNTWAGVLLAESRVCITYISVCLVVPASLDIILTSLGELVVLILVAAN